MGSIDKKLSFLNDYGISIKNATKIVAMPKKIIDADNEIYFCALVYEFRDEWIELIGFLIAMTELELKDQLKKIYNCDYLMQRTYKNFAQWYYNISGKKIPYYKKLEIKNKFYE